MKEPRPGAFDYLLKDIDHERRVPLHDLVRDIPPPRRDDPERRITHITIELVPVVRPRPRRRDYSAALIVWAIITVICLFSTAHGQPTGSTRYEHWQSTDGSHGEIRQQGRTIDRTDYGPRGERHNCHTYFVGDQPITSCN